MRNRIGRRRRIRTFLHDLTHTIELISGVVIAATGLVLLLLAASALIQQKLDDLLKGWALPAVRPDPKTDAPDRPGGSRTEVPAALSQYRQVRPFRTHDRSADNTSVGRLSMPQVALSHLRASPAIVRSRGQPIGPLWQNAPPPTGRRRT